MAAARGAETGDESEWIVDHTKIVVEFFTNAARAHARCSFSRTASRRHAFTTPSTIAFGANALT